ncbi:hypothetical protein N7517_011166 [Penicillium concentricum]|uniref:Uncharacterized protein n=1 Tax=Penicillium concentricum TaxID=293559 RepID=A0A9W9RAD2_9EURO|nr:uncharacterized protein N7517_011166 [Penicillium concentricum]KAJ5356557.1 hypothetical protein N7517_011166 [Penicillium concentricum]
MSAAKAPLNPELRSSSFGLNELCFDYVLRVAFDDTATGGIPLVGRTYAHKIGNLCSKSESAVKSSTEIFTLGPVAPLKSFVYMPRTITRQSYKLEQTLDSVIDRVGTDHHHLAVLLSDVKTKSKTCLIKFMDISGYHIECGDLDKAPGIVDLTLFRKAMREALATARDIGTKNIGRHN